MTGDASETPEQQPGRRLSRRVIAACGLGAVTLYLVMVTWMFWGHAFSPHEFKAYFSNDQESYLAISTNFAHGDFRSVEPFTQTGSIYYPRLYYQLLGLLAYSTHSDPVIWWWIGSLGTQAMLAGTVGAVSAALTGRRWTALLGPLALTVGVFGELRGTGWLIRLQDHAVIWGPFAEFFAGNGATVAASIISVALIALVGVVSGRITGRSAVAVALVVALVLGGMSAVHTYSFLTGTYVVSYVLAFRGLLSRGGRLPAAASAVSVALLGGLFVLGPRLAEGAGPLTVLVLGLVPAAPGVLMAVGSDRRVLGFLAAFALTALPQVLLTTIGVASGDPFLKFREVSTADLGVPLGVGLFHGLLLLVALALILAAGLSTRQPWWTALALGSTVSWVLLWTNDSWGADQEPYRLWLNGFAVLVPLVMVVGAWVVGELDLRWVRLAAAGFVVLAVLSLSDYLAFSLTPGVADTLDYRTPQLDAAARATADVPHDRGGSLVLAGPCLAPRALKIRTGLAIAYENVGLAWSPRHDALVALVPDMWAGHSPPADAPFDAAAARAAGVRYVLTDSGCPGPSYADPSLQPVRSSAYEGASGATAFVRLWRLR